MSDALTARQTLVLKTIIDEYIETAEPVGSETIDKKYNLSVSPATIRSEMAALIKMGYLRQPHTSSGRVPSPKAMKFYVDQLMEEKQMSVAEEVKAKEEVWDVRKNLDELMEEATHALSTQTRSLAVGTISDEDKVWHAGYANIFTNPEFADLAVCESLFSFLEEERMINDLFFKRSSPESLIDILFGEELGWPNFAPVGIVATHFNIFGKNAALGVIGTTRLSFPKIIPVLKYFKSMMEEVANS